VAALRGEAAAAAERGDFVLALRFYLFALVVGLGEHGDLEYRSSWTNRELIERGNPQPEIKLELTRLFDELDPLIFGRRGVGQADVERLARVCDDYLGEVA